MKTKKIFAILFMALTFALTMSGCDKCDEEDPRARVINNGTQKASVQIKTSGGNTVNINNVDPGTASPYASYAPGIVTFTIVVSNANYVKEVEMKDCFEYDIAIDANNTITSTPIDRNE